MNLPVRPSLNTGEGPAIDDIEDPGDFIAKAKQLALAELAKPQTSRGRLWEDHEKLHEEAKRLMGMNPDGSFVYPTQDRHIELREFAKGLGLHFYPDQIRRVIQEARAALALLLHRLSSHGHQRLD